MTQPPDLTDRRSLDLHRARADGSAWFLHEEALDEIQERLRDVNRRFTSPAIVTSQPALWASWMPDAKVVLDQDMLDLTPGAHDLVVHAMALHWSNDPVGQLVQCRRALTEDGLLIVACLGGQTLNELRSALAEAETALLGGLSPRVAPMGEVRDLGGLLQRAGLALPVADTLTRTVSYRDLPHLAKDLRAMGETNALAARHRGTPPHGLFELANHIYANSFPEGEARIRATFELIFLTGWAPSDTQQKPLRPGSAASRLADALGTVEFNEEATPQGPISTTKD